MFVLYFTTFYMKSIQIFCVFALFQIALFTKTIWSFFIWFIEFYFLEKKSLNKKKINSYQNKYKNRIEQSNIIIIDLVTWSFFYYFKRTKTTKTKIDSKIFVFVEVDKAASSSSSSFHFKTNRDIWNLFIFNVTQKGLKFERIERQNTDIC